MKKFLGILVLVFLWCSNVYAEKGDGICAEMELYKLYLHADYGTNIVGKNLFNKTLDNDSSFDESVNFLN